MNILLFVQTTSTPYLGPFGAIRELSIIHSTVFLSRFLYVIKPSDILTVNQYSNIQRAPFMAAVSIPYGFYGDYGGMCVPDPATAADKTFPDLTINYSLSY